VKLLWYVVAEQDLGRAIEYVEQANPQAALHVKTRLITAVEHLRRFPEAGRVSRVAGAREIVVPEYDYTIRYRIKDDAVQVLRVFHARRQWLGNDDDGK